MILGPKKDSRRTQEGPNQNTFTATLDETREREREREGTNPRLGPPFIRSKTWAGLRSCLKRRRNLTPWLSPDLELTKTRRGEQPCGRTASHASSLPGKIQSLASLKALMAQACHEEQQQIRIGWHYLSACCWSGHAVASCCHGIKCDVTASPSDSIPALSQLLRGQVWNQVNALLACYQSLWTGYLVKLVVIGGRIAGRTGLGLRFFKDSWGILSRCCRNMSVFQSSIGLANQGEAPAIVNRWSATQSAMD